MMVNLLLINSFILKTILYTSPCKCDDVLLIPVDFLEVHCESKGI